MNKKKFLFTLSITALGLTALVMTLTNEHFLNVSNELVIKRDGYIRNLTAFNGLSIISFEFDGSSTGVEAVLGSYNKELHVIGSKDPEMRLMTISSELKTMLIKE